MSPQTAIVIGGGVIGLSTAYHLARRKYGRIILLDKGPLGQGSSIRAAGIITGLLWSETGVKARQVSLQRFREMSQELQGYRFQHVGCLNLFDPDSWPQRAELLPLYDRLSAPYEILQADEIARRWPGLKPTQETTGLFDPMGGYSEPDEYIPALARQLRALGVEIREDVAVTGFQLQGGCLTGVETAQGSVAADVIISTVHAWTLQLMQKLGVQWPIKAFVHQRYVTEPLAAPPIPAINANPLGGYLRPAAGNRILAGVETPQRSEVQDVSQAFTMDGLSAPEDLIQAHTADFASLLPTLDTTTWAEERVGLLSFSSDGEPILGPVQAVPGLYVDITFHSGGFAYNPAAGQFLAEWIVDGHPHIDLQAFSPDRFTVEEIRTYLTKSVTQADAVNRRH